MLPVGVCTAVLRERPLMVPQRVNSTHLRTKTRDIIEAAYFLGQHFIIENHGRPVAVILGIAEYERMMKSCEKYGEGVDGRGAGPARPKAAGA